MDTAFQLAVLFFSIVIHEVAHGYASLRMGDPTARDAHRITLNPLAHIDPFGTILLPLILIWTHSPVLLGWAKPVPFNPMYFRDIRKGIMVVGAAGPAANLILAAVSGVVVQFIGPGGSIGNLLYSACIINVGLAVFNMIPIPPLDGSRVAFGIVPPRWLPAYMRLERFGFIIIFALLMTPILSDWFIRPVSHVIRLIFLGPYA